MSDTAPATGLGRRLYARTTRWIDIWRLLPKAGIFAVSMALLMNITIGLLPIGFIVALGLLLGNMPNAEGTGVASSTTVAAGAAIAITALLGQQMFAPFQAAVTEVISRRVDEHCVERLLRATMREAPMSVLDDPAVLNILADSRAAFERVARTPGDAAAAMLPLIARYVQLLGAAVLVAVVLSPSAGLIVAVTALAIRYGVRGTLGRYAALWNSLSAERRKVAYMRDIATGVTVAKDIRVLGILPWLRERLRSDSMANLLPHWAGSRRLQFWPFIGLSAVGLVGGAVVMVMLVRAGSAGDLTLLEFGIAVQAVLIPMRFGVHFPECDVHTQFGLQSFQALERLEQEIAATASGEGRGDVVTGAPPPALRCAIRFENVSFRYADDMPWVLRDLTLDFPAGGCTAIVGLNGAGKTTLVKLLARMYEPTSGRITVDGVDLATVDSRSWQNRLAVIFQDYVRYELTVAENIGLGAPELMHDRQAILQAARDAGALEALESLPSPLDTVLSRRQANGSELSGGQWQRIALARALFAVRGGASILVLDEPTAQLDVRAEVEFHDRFLTTAQDITSVIISHRFSTVRHADQIAVLEHGRLLESGDHDTLMRQKGRYAELFELQARRFQSTEDGMDDDR